MRSNSMELITVQQMVQYKQKFIEIDANYAKSEKYKEEVNLCDSFYNIYAKIFHLFM